MALGCFLTIPILLSAVGRPAFAQGSCTADAVRLPPPLYTPDDAFPATDGPVLSLHNAGDALYLAGSFEHLGTYSGGLVVLKDGTPQLDGSWPKVEGSVLAVEPDGAGGWYIGGRFERVGSFFRKNVAHLFEDGTVDPCFAPGGEGPTPPDLWVDSDGFVHRIAVAPDKVVLAGTFQRMGGLARNLLCAVSREDGYALDWDPELEWCEWNYQCGERDAVNDLQLAKGILYVGGQFDQIAGGARSNLAAFDARTLKLLPWAPQTDGPVRAVERIGDKVFLGGDFTTVGGRPRRNLAAVDAGSGVTKRWSPDPDGTVCALRGDRERNRLYVGGEFRSTSGRPRNHLARYRLDPREMDPWKPEPDGPVAGIEVTGGGIAVCGEFASVGDTSRSSFALLDPRTGRAKDLDLRAEGEVVALATGEGNTLVAGGFFSLVHAVGRRNLAAVNPRTGAILIWNPSSDGAVREMEWVGDRAYLGGSFFEVVGEPRRNLACVDTDGTLLPWNPSAYIQDWEYVGDPGALCPIGDRVFMGGIFEDWLADWTREFPLVAADALLGEPLQWNPSPPVSWGSRYGVNSLAGDASHLYGYVPGDWNDAHKELVALDPETAQILPFPFEGWVDKFGLRGDLLYISGVMTSIATGEERLGISQIDRVANRFTSFSPGSHEGQERLGMPSFSGLFPTEEGLRVLVPDWLSEGEWTVGEGCCDRWVLLDEVEGRILQKGAGLAGRAISIATAGERAFVGGALRGPWPNLHPYLAATRSAPLLLPGLVLRTDAAQSYQWHRDGLPVPGATGREFAPGIPGRYSVTVTDASGMWTSPDVEVGP